MKTKEWLPKSKVKVHDIYLSKSSRTTDGVNYVNTMNIEIIDQGDVSGLGGSRYKHITRKKIEDVLFNRVRKIPFLPLYFYCA